MSAVKNGDLPMVQLLLRFRAEANTEDANGFTPLMAAASLATTKLKLRSGGLGLDVDEEGTAVAKSASIEISRLLLSAGADINGKVHPVLGTALHIAVHRNQSDVASDLLAGAADPNARNSVGETPLWNAVMKPERLNVLKLLLGHGADPNIRDNRGKSLFLIAVAFRHAGVRPSIHRRRSRYRRCRPRRFDRHKAC
jgi:ankyrin repeat protein